MYTWSGFGILDILEYICKKNKKNNKTGYYTLSKNPHGSYSWKEGMNAKQLCSQKNVVASNCCWELQYAESNKTASDFFLRIIKSWTLKTFLEDQQCYQTPLYLWRSREGGMNFTHSLLKKVSSIQDFRDWNDNRKGSLTPHRSWSC